ncbi:hypothetical protein PCE1_002336 [Barthelona sp. PCE]
MDNRKLRLARAAAVVWRRNTQRALQNRRNLAIHDDEFKTHLFLQYRMIQRWKRARVTAKDLWQKSIIAGAHYQYKTQYKIFKWWRSNTKTLRMDTRKQFILRSTMITWKSRALTKITLRIEKLQRIHAAFVEHQRKCKVNAVQTMIHRHRGVNRLRVRLSCLEDKYTYFRRRMLLRGTILPFMRIGRLYCQATAFYERNCFNRFFALSLCIYRLDQLAVLFSNKHAKKRTLEKWSVLALKRKKLSNSFIIFARKSLSTLVKNTINEWKARALDQKARKTKKKFLFLWMDKLCSKRDSEYDEARALRHYHDTLLANTCAFLNSFSRYSREMRERSVELRQQSLEEMLMHEWHILLQQVVLRRKHALLAARYRDERLKAHFLDVAREMNSALSDIKARADAFARTRAEGFARIVIQRWRRHHYGVVSMAFRHLTLIRRGFHALKSNVDEKKMRRLRLLEASDNYETHLKKIGIRELLSVGLDRMARRSGSYPFRMAPKTYALVRRGIDKWKQLTFNGPIHRVLRTKQTTAVLMEPPAPRTTVPRKKPIVPPLLQVEYTLQKASEETQVRNTLERVEQALRDEERLQGHMSRITQLLSVNDLDPRRMADLRLSASALQRELDDISYFKERVIPFLQKLV